jgi:taurine--2-oxoglutarate transaminase
MDLATAFSHPGVDADELGRLLEIDRDRILHSWGPQTAYEPRIIVGAEGSYYWDAEGRRFLDFISQAFYANIGHGQRRVTDAIAAQAGQLASVYSHGTVVKSLLAEKVLSLFPSSYGRVYFGSNGADAVELALKVARLTTGRQNIVAFWNGYHGASMGATSATAEHRGRLGSGEPVPGTILVPTPYHYRSLLRGATQADTDVNTVAFIRQTIEQVGPETVAAVLGEPYVTAGPGVIPAQSYWKQIRALCDEYGIMLISDEMISGFGRSGHWFARDWYDYEPDIICLGKGLSGGYAPISATVLKAEVVERFEDRPLPYGLTFAGHAVSCAAALACIGVIEADDLVGRSAETSRQLERALHELQDRHRCIGDIRMIGMFVNIELVRDRATKEAFPPDASLEGATRGGSGVGVDVGRRLRDNGVIVRPLPDIIKFGPPLTTDWSDISLGLEQIDAALDAVDAICH